MVGTGVYVRPCKVNAIHWKSIRHSHQQRYFWIWCPGFWWETRLLKSLLGMFKSTKNQYQWSIRWANFTSGLDKKPGNSVYYSYIDMPFVVSSYTDMICWCRDFKYCTFYSLGSFPVNFQEQTMWVSVPKLTKFIAAATIVEHLPKLSYLMHFGHLTFSHWQFLTACWKENCYVL